MDSFWKGAIAPTLQKHRDNKHDTFAEHEFSNGAHYVIDPNPVLCDHDPIDYDFFNPSRRYFFVNLTLHNGVIYEYLVPAESDDSPPGFDNVRDTVNDYAASPVEGGRDWFDYLDLDEPETLDNYRVGSRIRQGHTQGVPHAARGQIEGNDLVPRSKKKFSVEDLF